MGSRAVGFEPAAGFLFYGILGWANGKQLLVRREPIQFCSLLLVMFFSPLCFVLLPVRVRPAFCQGCYRLYALARTRTEATKIGILTELRL